MAAEPADIWAILEVVGTAIAGVWAGLKTAGHWLSGREATVKDAIVKMQAEMDKELFTLRERLHKQQNDTAANTLAIAVVQAQSVAVTDRLTKIERCVERVNDKQDEQTELLLKIYNEKT